MEYEKALEMFRAGIEATECEVKKDLYQTAISALEKQISQKPIDKSDSWAVCPVCGGSISLDNIQEHIENEENTFCEHCGQRLDWGD